MSISEELKGGKNKINHNSFFLCLQDLCTGWDLGDGRVAFYDLTWKHKGRSWVILLTHPTSTKQQEQLRGNIINPIKLHMEQHNAKLNLRFSITRCKEFEFERTNPGKLCYLTMNSESNPNPEHQPLITSVNYFSS